MPYTVKSGDTLSAIGASLGVSWQEIYNLNQDIIGSNPNLIKPGQVLKIPGESGEAGGGETTTTGADSPEALPRNAKLVKIGGNYRVVWSLGDNLGWAWYAISSEQLKNIYDTATPTPHFTVSNIGQFESKFGNNYWGNIAEVSLTSDSPWEDLKERIFNQFGFVAGFDDPEIRRLLMQAYFEDWNQNQFLVEYRNTNFYDSTTQVQRQWSGLSEAEKSQLIAKTAAELTVDYERYWGQPITSADKEIQDAAFKIASGQITREEWDYTTRTEARTVAETPEFRRRREEQEAQRAEGNQIENLTSFAESQWRAWVGPVSIPNNFGLQWGQWLASGERSEADLEGYLKDISNGRWQFKPEQVTWEDWAAPYKQQIKDTLELGSIDTSDPLLYNILNQDLSGVDLEQVIRQDKRFRSTRRMFNELATYAEDIGRSFGFVA